MLLPINDGEKMETLRGIATLDPDACRELAGKEGMSDIRGSLLLLAELVVDTRRMLEEIDAGILKGTWKDGDVETACQDAAQIFESLWHKLQGKLDELLVQLRIN